MIVPMRKVHVAARSCDHDRLLAELEKLGVMHLVPIDAKAAVADEQTTAAIDHAERAVQVLAAHEPLGEAPQLSADEAIEEVQRIHRQTVERQNRLGQLHRQVTELELWGDAKLEQFQQLQAAGLNITVATVPVEQVAALSAEFIQPIGETHRGSQLVALVTRGDDLPELPEEAELHELPPRDRPTVTAEAQRLHGAIQADTSELCRLVHLSDSIKKRIIELQRHADYTVASRGSLTDDTITALQGWVPADHADTLTADLAKAGIDAASQSFEPTEDDEPPTLIKYPGWAHPIKALFDMLGTLPGYKELDLGAFFMIGLPIFAAMLIGDAGYGLLFLLVPLKFYPKATTPDAKAQLQLIMVLGFATIVWGLLTGNFFGLTPAIIASAGGVLAPVGNALGALQVFPSGSEQVTAIMKVSFVIAVIHLCLAQLRQALAVSPNIRALSHVGWASFLAGVFAVVWMMFFPAKPVAGVAPDPSLLQLAMPWLLIVGAGLAILFSNPSKNIAAMVGIGLANFPLAALSAFSDTISYIRLMGVGLASTIIAQTFNDLGCQAAGAGTWALGVPILLLGHGLNIALCMIAILAHGVRLNMLEFSNNVGVTWCGHAFAPFARKQS